MVTMTEQSAETMGSSRSSDPFAKSPHKKDGSSGRRDHTDFFGDAKPNKQPPADPEFLKKQQQEEKKQKKVAKLRAKEEKERQKQILKEEKEREKQQTTNKSQPSSVRSPSTTDKPSNLTSPKEKVKTPNNRISHVRAISYINCKISLLDGTVFDCTIDRRAIVEKLLDKVCEHISLEERDYFGFYYTRTDNKPRWLDSHLQISKQLPSSSQPEIHLIFAVKFYPPYPTQLQDDLTRYQLCLQVRKDIQTAALPCAELTYSLLGSYTAQSELGDYDLEEHGDGSDYLRRLPFLDGKTSDFYDKVAELHMAHKGMTPEQAEYHFLENARKLEFYGVSFHKAYDGESIAIELAVSARGLSVYRDSQRLSRFVWPQITKLTYRKNTQVFYVSLRPLPFEEYKRVIGFQMSSVEDAKHVWEDCSEHHTFFRLREPDAVKNYGLFTIGSQFRYSGRTQHQMRRSLSLSSMSRAGSIARLSSVARSENGRLDTR